MPEIAREPGAIQYMGDVILAQASTRGFQDAFTLLAIMAFMAIIPALMMAHLMKADAAAKKRAMAAAPAE